MTAQLDITGSSDNGYTPRQLADFQTAINAAMALIVDPATGETPFQNNTDDTVLQQIVAIIAEAVSASDNAAAWLARMRDPATASAALLSALVQLNGIIRKAGSPTILEMLLTGTAGTLVPAGSLIAEAEGTRSYATHADAVLDSSGAATVPAYAVEPGPYVPAAGTVVVIQTPVPGWTGATNTARISTGTDAEADAPLRRRQQVSTNATSYRQIEAIEAAVWNVPGVTFVRSYQNREVTTDDRGIPGKALAVVAVGGDEYDVCAAIHLRTPLGILYHGNVVRNFTDPNGETVQVRFSRPTERPVWLRITLRIVNDERIQIFPANGLDLIRQAVLDFAALGHTPCEPLGNTGFPPGQDIVRTYLYTPINSVGGAGIAKLELSLDGLNYGERDVAVAWNEIGVLAWDRIGFLFA